MIIQPTWLGQPFYPGGFPLKPDQVTAGNRTIHQIYFDAVEAEGEYSKDDEETLKSYIVYYINAPLFTSEFTEELRKMDLMSISVTAVIMTCMEYGLDPF